MPTLVRGTPTDQARRGFYQPIDPWAIAHRGFWTQPRIPADPYCPPVASPLYLLFPTASINLIPSPLAATMMFSPSASLTMVEPATATTALLAPTATHEACPTQSAQEACPTCS